MKRILLFAVIALGFSSCHQSHKGDLNVETLVKSSYSWNDSILPYYPEGQPEISILRIEIPPQTKLDLHLHPVINAGVLLKGELKVIADNGQELHMKAGDALIELVDNYHYGMNPGNKTAEIIVFYAGIKDQPITEYKKK